MNKAVFCHFNLWFVVLSCGNSLPRRTFSTHYQPASLWQVYWVRGQKWMNEWMLVVLYYLKCMDVINMIFLLSLWDCLSECLEFLSQRTLGEYKKTMRSTEWCMETVFSSTIVLFALYWRRESNQVHSKYLQSSSIYLTTSAGTLKWLRWFLQMVAVCFWLHFFWERVFIVMRILKYAFIPMSDSRIDLWQLNMMQLASQVYLI